jgi:beta-glucosidase
LLSASPAIERLGVPAYDWWNECLHGVARAGRATVFPETIGVAATWDTVSVFRAATAISDEARAKHHEFVRRGKRGIYQGLTFWTPNINLFRDPRWGRGMETYGEDPYLTSRMAVEFIRGLEGDDPRYLKTVATAKHYAVHSGPESSRHVFDARCFRDRPARQLPAAFRSGHQGGRRVLGDVRVQQRGRPAGLRESAAAGRYPARGVGLPRLRGFRLRRGRRYLPGAQGGQDRCEGVAMAVKAGTDLDCGLEYENVVPAVRQGLLTEKDVDTALRRLLTARFKLGMFDPPEMVRWAQIPYSVNDSPEHQNWRWKWRANPSCC